MDTTDAVRTKLDSREFGSRPVPAEVKKDVLESARLTQSGVNSQHWRFILVQDPKSLTKLAADSSSGSWIAGANFAVIVCTDPKRGYHLLDAGRATQDMMLTAWDHGVTSRLYTGINQDKMKRDFGVPGNLTASVVAGFGYPKRKIIGRKNRLPLSQIAFLEKYGEPLSF